MYSKLCAIYKPVTSITAKQHHSIYEKQDMTQLPASRALSTPRRVQPRRACKRACKLSRAVHLSRNQISINKPVKARERERESAERRRRRWWWLVKPAGSITRHQLSARCTFPLWPRGLSRRRRLLSAVGNSPPGMSLQLYYYGLFSRFNRCSDIVVRVYVCACAAAVAKFSTAAAVNREIKCRAVVSFRCGSTSSWSSRRAVCSAFEGYGYGGSSRRDSICIDRAFFFVARCGKGFNVLKRREIVEKRILGIVSFKMKDTLERKKE